MPAKAWIYQPPCTDPECEVHYSCRLRRKGVQAAAHIHARQRSTPQPVRPLQDPSWEKGIITTTRPNGMTVPVLHANGTPWRQKEAAENRHLIDERLRQTYAANP